MNLMKKTEEPVQQPARMEMTPASHVDENTDTFTLTVALPGVNKTDIDVTLENRTLSVTAENSVAYHKDHTLVLSEIPEVRYRVAFDLPQAIDSKGVKAANRNGMLILTLPKSEEVKPQRIAITA